MSASAIDFPWVGRNPFRQAAIVWLFSFLLFLPLAVVSIAGRHHWWPALTPVFCATGMAAIFLPVSLTVRAIMRGMESTAPAPAADEEFRSSGLVVKNLIKQPAIIIVQNSRLILKPMFGAPVEISLSQISAASEHQFFNGRLYYSGKGFWLKTAGYSRLGVVVREAATFRSVLEGHNIHCCWTMICTRRGR